MLLGQQVPVIQWVHRKEHGRRTDTKEILFIIKSFYSIRIYSGIQLPLLSMVAEISFLDFSVNCPGHWQEGYDEAPFNPLKYFIFFTSSQAGGFPRKSWGQGPVRQAVNNRRLSLPGHVVAALPAAAWPQFITRHERRGQTPEPP